MHVYFSLHRQQLCVSAQAFTIHVKVARFQIRRLSRRHLSFSPSKSVGVFFMIAHLSTLIISSFTSSVGFPAERSLLRKARSASHISRTSLGGQLNHSFFCFTAKHLQHLHSFLPPLYPQMCIMANVQMRIFRKANTAAY